MTSDLPPEPDPEVAAVVLAAGQSVRMGRPKLLLVWEGKSLLRRAAEAAGAACRQVVVVLGPEPQRMEAELSSLPVEVVVNPEYAKGMATSLRCGIQAVGDATAALVVLADQPAVTAEHLRRLIQAYRRSGAPLAAAAYGDTVGAPAVFSRQLFPELLALEGDTGAKRVVESHRHEAVVVPLPEAAVDVDAAEDWQRLLSPAADTAEG